MISSDARSRWPRGFSRTSTSPLFCCVANNPSSEPVRRWIAATSGVLSRTSSTFLSCRSVSSSARPGGRLVVDDEAALVGVAAGSRFRRRNRAARRRPPARAPRAARAPAGRGSASSVLAYTSSSRPPGCAFARSCLDAPPGEQRNQRQRQDQRREHRRGERQRQGAEKLADDARQETQRREHDDRRQRRADDRGGRDR